MSSSEGSSSKTRGSRLAFAGLAVLGAAALSGLPLAFALRPTPEWITHDLLDLQQTSPWAFVHALHGWLAQGAVVVAWGMVLWLVVRGAYRTDRRALWWGALALLLGVTAWVLTGRLLRWDPEAQHWLAEALSVDQVGGRMLLVVWVGHCLVLPILGLLTLGWVRRALRRSAGTGLSE